MKGNIQLCCCFKLNPILVEELSLHYLSIDKCLADHTQLMNTSEADCIEWELANKLDQYSFHQFE